MSIRFIFGLIIGLSLGATIALALAPQDGAATRQQLWEKAMNRAGHSVAG